jgi:hypothetical protein
LTKARKQKRVAGSSHRGFSAVVSSLHMAFKREVERTHFDAKLDRMAQNTLQGRHAEAVRQFSVFTANRLGQLNSLVGLLASNDVHILALTVLDSTESAIVRFIADDPLGARRLLQGRDIPFTESEVLVVELNAVTDLKRLVAALLQAELNINYMYSFIPHVGGKSLLVLHMEDNETGEQSLHKAQFRTLKQSDISR